MRSFNGRITLKTKLKNRYFSITILRKRLLALICAVTFIFLFIIGKTFFVTVVDGDKLRVKAIDQWTRELPIKAIRGKIVDRNGVILAADESTYSVFVRTRCVTNFERVADVLSKELGCDHDGLLEKLNKKGTSEITVARQISKEQTDKLKDYSLDGVYFSPDGKRNYPFNQALCQTLGYTSSDGNGLSGIEKYYNRYLQGTDGKILYESDLVGLDMDGKSPSYLPAVNGLNVKLTIDSEIQLICEDELDKVMAQYTPVSAKILMLEPGTGKVLAMAQKPSFDLNEVPRDDKEQLMKLGRNGIIADSYEPGSTFKVITASANIEETLSGNKNAFSLEHVYNSGRYRIVGGRKIKCWSTHAGGKHSNQKLSDALNNSCNPIFVDIALSLGKSTFYKYVNAFNFGKTTGIDFQGEALGMVVPERSVTDGDLARIGFGQTIAVTPLQLAAAVSAAVRGGVYHKPYLVEEIYSDTQTAVRYYPVQTERVISEQASKIIASYLEGVVRDGSGKQAYIEGAHVGGKTGTAQIYKDGVIAQGKYVMSFIGFFPAGEPKYLALVIVEEPIGGTYGSTVAAPVCKNVFQRIINAKSITERNHENKTTD